ncbi:MAG TPA: hypothetical protein VNO31_19410 [Umezawaea sp.]|nr:hypothetical protein [Umezawaea sp.]
MNHADQVLAVAGSAIAAQHRPNVFVERLEAGEVSLASLGRLAGELYHLVRSDQRSFALAAARFPDAPFLVLAAGEAEALGLLLDFAAAVGVTPQDCEPHPLAQAYPAYLAQTAAYGSRSDLALALLANAPGSGAVYRRVADALQSRYAMADRAVAHFRFLADTPGELLDDAKATLTAGLAAGDEHRVAVRTALMVHDYEHLFWDSLT